MEELRSILKFIGVPDIRSSLKPHLDEKLFFEASSECLNKLKSLVDITSITAESELFLDAAGKPSAGLTTGNHFWIGDYEMCKTLRNVTRQDYRSCKVTAQAFIEKSPIPLTLTWTGCIPEQCQNGSLTEVLPLLGDWVTEKTKGQITLNRNKWTSDCETDLELDAGAYAAITFLAIVGFLVVGGTIWHIAHPIILSLGQKYNHDGSDTVNVDLDNGGIQAVDEISAKVTESPFSNAVKCFSLQRTFKSLTSTETKPGQVLCLNGIRVLSINWVILGHTFAFVQGKLSDQSYLLDLIKRQGFTLIANAYSSVDSFFCLSGFLVSYLLLKQLTKKGHLTLPQWIAFYFHRYVRLTAPYLMMILLEGFLYRHLVSGPFSVEADIATNHETCKKYWWTNLLYINNLVPWNPTASPCLAQSWYLANDMQFFVISPIFIVLLFLYPKIGNKVNTVALGCSATAAGLITAYYNLEPSMSLGNPQNFVKLYRVPWVRITPYLVGILGGWFYWCWGEDAKEIVKIVPLWKKAIVALPFWVVTALIEYGVVTALIEYGVVTALIEYGVVTALIEYGVVTALIEYGVVTALIEYGVVTALIEYGVVTALIEYGVVTALIEYGVVTALIEYGVVTALIEYGVVTALIEYGVVTALIEYGVVTALIEYGVVTALIEYGVVTALIEYGVVTALIEYGVVTALIEYGVVTALIEYGVVTALIEYGVVFGLWSDLKDRFLHGKAASNTDSIAYEAVARIAWSLALLIQILLCQFGLGGFINSLLSWKGWLVLSRLTYSVYLIHLGLICLIMTETRHSFSLEPDFEMAVFYLGVMLMSYLAAVVLYVCVEQPIASLEGITYRKK